MPFSFPGQTAFYRGKVRDVYTINDHWLVMLASDRISAFDVILPRAIPFKGQVLNQMAAFMLHSCSDICPIWLLDVPASNVSVGLKCMPIKIEMVVRGNLVGHAWRTYSSGKRTLCGATLPERLKENDFFPAPVITPSTKAAEGHDEDISPAEIIAQGIASEELWNKLCSYALALFERGRKMAAQRGLILADTKYEFGIIGDTVYLMDEIHTPDSSRYFYADGFDLRQAKGEKQVQLSKEFVREWLMENGFMGKPGQSVPEMTDEWVNTISARYITLFEIMTGERFIPSPMSESDTEKAILKSLDKITGKSS